MPDHAATAPALFEATPADLAGLSRVLIEYAPLPMAAVEGPSHLLRHANPAFCRLLKQGLEELRARPFPELLPQQDLWASRLDRVYHSGQPESCPEESPDPNPLFSSFSMWPLRHGEITLGIMIQLVETTRCHDHMLAMNEALVLGALRQHELTEAAEKLNVRLQGEVVTRQHLEAQLREAQKMEAVGQLTGGIAHDFNNILTVINGYSELVLERLSPDDSLRQPLTIIRDAGDQAAAITRQLLDFSRQTVITSEILDLNSVIANGKPMLQSLFGEGFVLTFLLEPRLRRVRFDPNHLGQILLNTAVNARDAMARGGTFTVSTTNVLIDDSDARVQTGVQPGPYVLLSIADSGTGMSPEVKARMFEPFFTTKGVGKGTGLGLAVVYGIIKQSGGLIEVDSQPNVGTTFKFYLPATNEPASLPERPPAVKSLRGSETILLAEDDPHLRTLSALALQDFGYRLLQAADGQDALRLLQDHPEPIDLLATDIVMPHLGGRELADILRARFPKMKILFMSGYTNDAVVRHGIEYADFAFLQKPYTPNVLRLKIRQVLDEESP
jgi:two-component system, cell cycle sensor histidine kinase and response regulator CckA